MKIYIKIVKNKTIYSLYKLDELFFQNSAF